MLHYRLKSVGKFNRDTFMTNCYKEVVGKTWTEVLRYCDELHPLGSLQFQHCIRINNMKKEFVKEECDKYENFIMDYVMGRNSFNDVVELKNEWLNELSVHAENQGVEEEVMLSEYNEVRFRETNLSTIEEVLANRPY